MTTITETLPRHALNRRHVLFVGKLAGMSKREAQQLVRGQGAHVVESADATADLVVVGERESVLNEAVEQALGEATRARVERGECEVIAETQLWQRLGLVEQEHHIHRLYTPAMLADLLGVPVAVIRRWHRRGLIVPAREVRKLAYFDFREVASARRLAELLAAGVSPDAIEKKLAELARFLPGVERPLAQLSVIVEGKQLLLRQGEGLVEPGGQLRFDFGAAADTESPPAATAPASILTLSPLAPSADPAIDPQEILASAGRLEDEGHLEAATDMYRAALAAGGPSAETCFRLAELLYQLGDLPAARERYFMAIELDEDYVEARANLGCVLAEMGERELAAAAFEGALAYHGDYPDVHFHLARTLDELRRSDEAEHHWRAFLELAPDSPWADEARRRVEG